MMTLVVILNSSFTCFVFSAVNGSVFMVILALVQLASSSAMDMGLFSVKNRYGVIQSNYDLFFLVYDFGRTPSPSLEPSVIRVVV